MEDRIMTEMARVIRPIPITPDNIVSSNVPEDNHDEWEDGPYTKGAFVIHGHRIWEALDDTSTEPGTDAGANDWLDLGATNQWRMFDNKVGTQTENKDGIKVVIEHDDFVGGVAALNVESNAI